LYKDILFKRKKGANPTHHIWRY